MQCDCAIEWGEGVCDAGTVLGERQGWEVGLSLWKECLGLCVRMLAGIVYEMVL